MKGLIELINTYGGGVILIILAGFGIAVKEVVEFCEWIMKHLNRWRNKRNGEENRVKTVDERLETLEAHDKYQHGQIKELKDSIDEIKKLIIAMQKREDEVTVATCRDKLYELHRRAVEEQGIDKEGLKTFLELGKVYEQSGGDDIYHDKLYPEIMSLPIKQ